VVFAGNSAFDATGASGCSGAPKTCAPLWNLTSGEVDAAANGVAYATSSSTITTFDASGTMNCTGMPKTCAPLSTTPLATPTSPVVVNGTLYAGSTDNKLHAYALT
jgi:hypothetical protein